MLFILLLLIPQLGLHGQHFLGTVLKVEKDTKLVSIDFDNSTDSWQMSNVLMVDTRNEDVNSLYNVSQYYHGGGEEEEEEVGVVLVPAVSMTGQRGGSLTTSVRVAGEGEARLLLTFLLYISGTAQIRYYNRPLVKLLVNM